jgi:caspase domain-containing protein
MNNFFYSLIVYLISSGLVFGQYSKKEKKYFPKISPDANVVLDLSSNINNTLFIIDGKEVMKTKRVLVLINKGPHTIQAVPEGYISKEDYIQPPYFDNQTSLRFTFLLEDRLERQPEAIVEKTTISKPTQVTKDLRLKNVSDVDVNIPTTTNIHTFRYALIIGNEDYTSFQQDLANEVNVDFAVNDATIFREYAISTLGIPKTNVFLLTNATSGQMRQAISKINKLAEKTNGKAEIFFYYAGHGLPDEITKEAYLMPVDVSGSNVNYGIKLNDLYKQFTEYPTNHITVFIDACFSGGARNQGLLAARGVKIKPKKEQLTGKLVVFAASTGDQSSLAYKEKSHGMFSYYLFKKLNESKGRLSYGDLSDYLIEQVGLQSVLINSKEQDPQVNVSPSAVSEWENWRFD